MVQITQDTQLMVQKSTADGAERHYWWCRETLLMVQRDTADDKETLLMVQTH